MAALIVIVNSSHVGRVGGQSLSLCPLDEMREIDEKRKRVENVIQREVCECAGDKKGHTTS